MNERISDEDLSRILEAYSLHLGRATRAAASLRAGPDAARAIVAALSKSCKNVEKPKLGAQ